MRVVSHAPGAQKLRNYWTKGPGLAKWSVPRAGAWRRLRRQLSKYLPPGHKLDATVSRWYIIVFGGPPNRRDIDLTGETYEAHMARVEAMKDDA